jgi:hypothetical protein
MGKNLLLNLLLLLSCGAVVAQNRFNITGMVRDKKETLPGAAIYISGYKIATISNNEGKFTLSNLPAGNYDVLVQVIGYLPFSKNVAITDKSVQIEVLLAENTTMLKEVVIKPDPNRIHYINLFKKFFIGATPNSAACKILNTDVLTVNDDPANKMISISANEFLIIENLALGYRIKFLLKYFEYNVKTQIVYYAGYSTFEELLGGSSKRKRWEKNREIAYRGSVKHFFQSLYQHKITEEGFVLYKKTMVKNPKKLPDSLITANIKRLATGPNSVINLITYNGGNDSLSYWLKQRKEPEQFGVINRAPILVDTLVKSIENEAKVMDFQDILYVVYKNESEAASYDFSGFKQNRPPDLKNYQISLIQKLGAPIKFYVNGVVDNPRLILYGGHLAYEKVGDLLPLDYVSTVQK